MSADPDILATALDAVRAYPDRPDRAAEAAALSLDGRPDAEAVRERVVARLLRSAVRDMALRLDL